MAGSGPEPETLAAAQGAARGGRRPRYAMGSEESACVHREPDRWRFALDLAPTRSASPARVDGSSRLRRFAAQHRALPVGRARGGARSGRTRHPRRCGRPSGPRKRSRGGERRGHRGVDEGKGARGRTSADAARIAGRYYAASKPKSVWLVGSRARARRRGAARTPRCVRILLTARGSVMVARTRSLPSQEGQRSASKPKGSL
jgi:hypothetical protein